MKMSADELVEIIRRTAHLIEENNVDLVNKISELEKQTSAQDGIILLLKQQRDEAIKELNALGPQNNP